MHEKICKIHGQLSQENIQLETNKTYKIGYALRCRLCRLNKNRKWKDLNRDKHNTSACKARNESRRLFREGEITDEPKANVWAREDRLNNPEKYRKWNKAASDKLGPLRTTRQICSSRKISIEQYESMLISQNNKCAICHLPEKRKNRNGDVARLCLDHCHKTNKVRKFLCHDCNTMLGKFKESIEIIESAINFLKIHGEVCK